MPEDAMESKAERDTAHFYAIGYRDKKAAAAASEAAFDETLPALEEARKAYADARARMHGDQAVLAQHLKDAAEQGVTRERLEQALKELQAEEDALSVAPGRNP